MCGTGTDSSYPTYVAIMGTVFDVSGNSAYSPKNPYNGTELRTSNPVEPPRLCRTKTKHQLTKIPSFRRERRLTSSRSIFTQAGGL